MAAQAFAKQPRMGRQISPVFVVENTPPKEITKPHLDCSETVTASNITHTSQHAALLVQDHSGNTSWFNCIIETHQTKAYNLARRMLDDWSLAEDAVHESLVSAYRAFSKFRGDNLPAWLMRIVANTCRVRPTVPLGPTPVDQ